MLVLQSFCDSQVTIRKDQISKIQKGPPRSATWWLLPHPCPPPAVQPLTWYFTTAGCGLSLLTRGGEPFFLNQIYVEVLF